MADRSILVVDDNEINRGILGEIFKDQYNILEAGKRMKKSLRLFFLILLCLKWTAMRSLRLCAKRIT